MTEDLFKTTELQDDIRAGIREIAEEQIAPYAADVDQQARFPTEALKALSETEFHAAHIPEEYGGPGVDAITACIIIEEIARVCASSSLIPAVNKLATMPMILSGNTDICQRYLPEAASTDTLFAYCLTEREAGSDTAAMRTKAVRKGDDWVLNGVKAWISNAGAAKYYTVIAVTDPDGPRGRNITAFVVHRDDPGFDVGAKERKLGIKGSPTREVFLDHVRIGDDRRISEVGEGLILALHTLDHTRVTIGAQAVGIAQGALDYAVGYLKERKQFGKPLAEFQGLQFMVADMAIQLEAARQLVYVAAAKSERGDRDLAFFGAAAKAYASDVAMSVTTDAVQLLGGAGYVSDHPVERMMRDAKITQIYEGTNQIQRIVAARHLLGRGFR